MSPLRFRIWCLLLASLGGLSEGIAVFSPASSWAQESSPSSPLVIGETFTLESQVLGETRRINVYLPRPVADESGAVPVLYMLDGGLQEDFLHIAGLVQVGVANGTMRRCLLVGIENTQRRRDLTGPSDNAEDRKIAAVVGGSAAFRQFFREELRPEIQRRYACTESAAIVGESLAGLFVVETFFLEPDLFDTYIAIDPSLWWNNQALLKTAAERLPEMSGPPRTLYLAHSGEPQIAKDAQQLAELLKQHAPASLAWHYRAFPEEQHATIFHPAALQAFRVVWPR